MALRASWSASVRVVRKAGVDGNGTPRVTVANWLLSVTALLSPAFGAQCRFYPTCSQYALDAIARHGAGKGLLLAACRIARCNPLCEGGDDPAPEHFSLLKLKS